MTKKPFILPLLPPEAEFTSLFKLIIKTRDIIARYDESVKKLLNPKIIQRSFEGQFIADMKSSIFLV